MWLKFEPALTALSLRAKNVGVPYMLKILAWPICYTYERYWRNIQARRAKKIRSHTNEPYGLIMLKNWPLIYAKKPKSKKLRKRTAWNIMN